jgi:hemolysin D
MVNEKVAADSKNTAISPIVKHIVGQSQSIRIILVDDSNSIRETLCNYLAPQADFQIVGSFDNAQTALEQIKTLNPDIVLMDIEMPDMDGIRATRAITQQFSQVQVIILSSYDEQLYLEQVLNAGAKGYLVKTTPVDELAHSIRFVHKGYLQFSPELLSKLESTAAIAPLIQSSTPSSSQSVLSRSSQIKPDWSSQTKKLIDTLSQVSTKGLLYFLAIFAVIDLPGAIFSKVDKTVKGRGRLEPSSKTFILDTPVAGTVAKINVQTGELVEAGQNLLKLESKLASAELQKLKAKLAGQQNQLNQLELFKQQLLSTFDTQQQFQFNQTSYNSQKAEKLAQVNQARQDLVYAQTALDSAKNILTKTQKEIERYRQALQQGIISEAQVIEQENLAAEKQQDYDKAKLEFQHAKLSLKELQNSYNQIIRQAESSIAKVQLQEQEQEQEQETDTDNSTVLNRKEQLKNTESAIATLTTEIAQSQSQIALAQYKLEQTVLKAPVKGIVLELPIQKPGEVLQPGVRVAEIAPENSPLVVIAQMAMAESDSPAKGMPVKLKFDAYPFQDYGIVTGKLTSISLTSKQSKIANYNLKIKLDRDCLLKANKCIALRPGDTVTAEVIVRQRRLIDFILDPLKKLQ